MSGHYSAQQRQALNQVWNAAGIYGFSPLFLSLDAKGRPDLYLNTIVGCVRKWYGEAVPERLFQSWAGDRRQALLDDLAWLALESAAFAQELPVRPLLAELRRAHAKTFFDREQTLSRQEWMAKNQISYTMQAARWRAVLERRPPVMTPYEKRLSAALDLAGLEGNRLFPAILEVFSRFRLFNGRTKPPSALRLRLSGRLAGMMTRLMPTEIAHTDVVDLDRIAGAGEEGAAGPRRAVLRLKEDASADRQYIESCFGPSLLPARELGLAEQSLCAGIHLGCRLWYTSGLPNPERAKNPEARRMAEQALLQAERNRAAFSADAALYQNAILRLTERIQNCLQVHSEAETETARRGRLDSSRVWRAAVLGDERVFQREEPSNRPGFAVDLLLDASASRLHCQETVAAQGYILAESLTRCGVPVRVSGFCSLRGYTVLRILKNFGDKSRGVFRYFASGWNRDGLALRAAGTLLEPPPDRRRILLVLTDASPSDSRRIPSGGEYPLGHDYDGAPAVKDAAREVRALERRGVRVGAVFMGPTANIPAAESIYGQNLARIRTMDQLAGAAGTLIQREIRELEG
nr:hypothetical protein [uncultured Oscillibacter sp.]